MVHRPRDVSGTFAAKAAAQASRKYSATLSAIDSYLLETDVPPSIIEKVKATPSNEIAFLAFEDVVRMERPPSIAEWLISSCGSLREDENEWVRQLHRFEEGQLYLTPQQVAYARDLKMHVMRFGPAKSARSWLNKVDYRENNRSGNRDFTL